MKLTPLVRATLVALALAATLVSARADLTPGAGYATSVYQTGPGGSIIGFDWDASNNLYYSTATPGFQFGGLYQGSNPTPVFAGNSNFPGASVTAVGGYVYFNDGNFNLYTYNPTTTLTGSTSAIANYALFSHSGKLFITGSGSSTNNAITYSNIGVGGALSVTAIEQDNAFSGPLTFDASGNLFYAPGFDPTPGNTNSIFEWSAAQVTAAIADPVGSGLVIGNSSASGNASLWDAYGLNYSSYAGGTSLVINNNQLYLSLTNFGGPSALVAFGMNSDSLGTFNGTSNLVLSDDASTGTSLGQLGINNGNLFIADGNQILQVESVPEPSTLFLVVLGMVGLGWFHLSRKRKLVPAGVLAVSIVFFSVNPAQAYTLQPAQQVTPIAANDSRFQEWANNAVSLNRGLQNITVSGTFVTNGPASNALGPADASVFNSAPVVSLGDGGSMTLSFAQPIANGPGADFAVFENGFAVAANADFLELAKVAVSSDGINFFTFPSLSLTQTGTQVNGNPANGLIATLDPANLYNLAGSALASFGTPFNLDDLANVSPLLNVNSIIQVRVTDVIGNINTGLGSNTYTFDDASNPIFNGAYGLTNNIINDPYTTPFPTGGFDLDAIGVLNVATVPEPSIILYLMSGLGALVITQRYYRRRVTGA